MDRRTILQHDFREATVELCWRQWTAAGLAGTHEDTTNLIDPEALLVASLALGRYDARLFDEVLDWLVGNWRLLDAARLKRIARSASSVQRALLGVASEIASADKGAARVRDMLANEPEDPAAASEPPQSLFFSETTSEASWTEADPVFEAAGFVRAPVRLRGLSHPPRSSNPACLRFKLRALVGIGSRAEVLAYLLTHSWTHGRLIAARAAYPQGPVAAYLVSLCEAGIVERRNEGKKALYRLRGDMLGSSNTRPLFVDWISLWPALIGLLDAMRPTTSTEEAWWLRVAQALVESRAGLRAEGFELEIGDLRGWGLQGPRTPEMAVTEVTTRVKELMA